MNNLSISAAAQRGIILFVVLIVLLVMTIGGVALMRSVETSALASGNLSFKMAALNASDVGVETAVAALPSIVGTLGEANYPAGCTPSSDYPNGCRYYALIQAVDSKGVPENIDWSKVQESEPVAGYKVRYVVDRLCQGTLPIVDIAKDCMVDNPTDGGDHAVGRARFTSATKVYYRITVRAEGPRSTESITQAVISY